MYTQSSQLDETAWRKTYDGKPKLLFLAYPFPPLRSPGSVRTWNIAKHLTRLGWDVRVVTPDPSIWRHVENAERTNLTLDHEGIRRVLTGHQWRMLAPTDIKSWNNGLGWTVGGICRRIARYLEIDSTIGWVKAAENACSSLASEDVDVILATAPPFSSFGVAKRLSERLRRPYVLDYRDLWSRNAHNPLPGAIEKESAVLADCAAVTTVSPFWASILDEDFGIGNKLHVVTNGYDPEELADVTAHDFGHFAIVYAGRFYPPKRVISPIMAALKRVRETAGDTGIQWYLHYYGNHQDHVKNEAARFGLTDRTVLHGIVARGEALSAVKGAGIAVIITSIANENSAEDNGIVTGKIFEILGLRARFLLISPSSSDATVIAASTDLGRNFTGNDVAGIAGYLSEVMSGGHMVIAKQSEEQSWVTIANQFDTVLRGLVGDKRRNSNGVAS